MSSYHTINDQKYSFIPLIELRNAVLEAGRKNIIFVEGCDDKRIFEVFYREYSDTLNFIDMSLEEAKHSSDNIDNNIIKGGDKVVMDTLKLFVEHLPDEKRFFGVTDRDLKTDEEINNERLKSCYDMRLYIFFSRYTIENYFIETNVLSEFIKDACISSKKLFKLDLGKLGEDIINPILNCMAIIAAANLTIKFFNDSIEELSENGVSLLHPTIKKKEIESLLLQKLNKHTQEEQILEKFNKFKLYLSEFTQDIHKFASAKTYFATQFNQKIDSICGVNLQINNHKLALARITKEEGLPEDFIKLLEFIKR